MHETRAAFGLPVYLDCEKVHNLVPRCKVDCKRSGHKEITKFSLLEDWLCKTKQLRCNIIRNWQHKKDRN